ncbi:MAG: helix-turn-helix domain-containing protein [Clostridiales bacterium]|nr:helix-turn-helix domain-containing protein [Clostridiales bacterium]
MYEMDFAKVGQKMKRLRMDLGVTQEKVANDLQCTIAFVSNVENNRAKLNLRVLLYYADLCHVPVDLILDAGRPEEAQHTPGEQQTAELLRLFQTFTPEEQTKLIRIMKLWQSKSE